MHHRENGSKCKRTFSIIAIQCFEELVLLLFSYFLKLCYILFYEEMRNEASLLCLLASANLELFSRISKSRATR